MWRVLLFFPQGPETKQCHFLYRSSIPADGCFPDGTFPSKLKKSYVNFVQSHLGIERVVKEEQKDMTRELHDWPPQLGQSLRSNGVMCETEAVKTDDVCGVACAGSSPNRVQAMALALIIDEIVMNRREDMHRGAYQWTNEELEQESSNLG